MKKIPLLFLLFALLATTSLTAQWQGGARAGFQLADLTLTNKPEQFANESEMRPAFHLGAFVRRTLNDRLGLQFELLYSQKGSKSTTLVPGPTNDEEMRFNLHYLCLPILLDVRLGVIHLEGGIEPGYQLQAVRDPKAPGFDLEDTFDQDFDLGLAGGIRYYLDRLSLGIRYVHGMSDLSNSIFTDQNGEPLNDSSWRNRVVMVTVGYDLIGTRNR